MNLNIRTRHTAQCAAALAIAASSTLYHQFVDALASQPFTVAELTPPERAADVLATLANCPGDIDSLMETYHHWDPDSLLQLLQPQPIADETLVLCGPIDPNHIASAILAAAASRPDPWSHVREDIFDDPYITIQETGAPSARHPARHHPW